MAGAVARLPNVVWWRSPEKPGRPKGQRRPIRPTTGSKLYVICFLAFRLTVRPTAVVGVWGTINILVSRVGHVL